MPCGSKPRGGSATLRGSGPLGGSAMLRGSGPRGGSGLCAGAGAAADSFAMLADLAVVAASPSEGTPIVASSSSEAHPLIASKRAPPPSPNSFRRFMQWELASQRESGTRPAVAARRRAGQGIPAGQGLPAGRGPAHAGRGHAQTGRGHAKNNNYGGGELA